VVIVKTWLAPLMALSTGCLPFVVPPGKVAIGAGPATGEVKRDAGMLKPRSVTQLRAGFHPLDMMPKASQSAFDVGVGYGGDLIFSNAPARHDQHTSAHGPYLEAAYYPLRVPAGNAMLRWGARGNLDLLYLEPKDVMGFGGTAVTELEITGHAAGAFADADGDGAVFGTSWGQWSVGAFVGGSARSFPVTNYRAITAGFAARIPFAAGIVCCAFFSGGGSDDSHHHHHTTTVVLPKRRHETRPATPVRSSPPPSKPPERIPTPKKDELKP
jgi:hypothetical protein